MQSNDCSLPLLETQQQPISSELKIVIYLLALPLHKLTDEPECIAKVKTHTLGEKTASLVAEMGVQLCKRGGNFRANFPPGTSFKRS